MPLPVFPQSRSLPRSARRRERRAGALWLVGAGALLLGLSWASPASAIPAFARKYGTSCTT
jgi:hypothetical protein